MPPGAFAPSPGAAPPVAPPQTEPTAQAREQSRSPARAADPAQPAALELFAPAQASLGSVFSVEVGVAAGTAARSAQITFSYDPQALQFINIAEGGSIATAEGGQPGSFRSNPTAGRASVSLQNAEDGRALGPASVQFRVISERKPSMEIAVNATLLDAAGNRLSVLPLRPHAITLVR